MKTYKVIWHSFWSRIGRPQRKPPPTRHLWVSRSTGVGLTEQDVNAAHGPSGALPYLAKAFANAAAGGMIEFDVVAIPAMQKRLAKEYGAKRSTVQRRCYVTGNLWPH